MCVQCQSGNSVECHWEPESGPKSALDGHDLYQEWSGTPLETRRSTVSGGDSRCLLKVSFLPLTHALSACSPIAEEEKAVVRSTLLQSLEEPVSQVRGRQGRPLQGMESETSLPCRSAHSSLCSLQELPASTALGNGLSFSLFSLRYVSLCASLLCSDHLPPICQRVRSSSKLMQKCSLLALKHVIKTLASKRLDKDRKMFYEVTTSLFVYVAQLWVAHLQDALALIATGNADSAVECLEMVRVCLKSE